MASYFYFSGVKFCGLSNDNVGIESCPGTLEILKERRNNFISQGSQAVQINVSVLLIGTKKEKLFSCQSFGSECFKLKYI